MALGFASPLIDQPKPVVKDNKTPAAGVPDGGRFNQG
jgi:hypothetical protein